MPNTRTTAAVRVCVFCALWHTNGDTSAIDYHVTDAGAGMVGAGVGTAVTAAVGLPRDAHVVVDGPPHTDGTDDRCDACCGRLTDHGPWYPATVTAS